MAFARILVPLDGSSRSLKVVPYISNISDTSDSKVLLLTVLPPSEESLGLTLGERGSLGQLRSEYSDVASQGYLDLLAEKLRKSGLETETEIRQGAPSQEIVKAASEWKCDVIAMATRANRGIKRLVLGSVAEGVLRESRVPVLLIAA